MAVSRVEARRLAFLFLLLAGSALAKPGLKKGDDDLLADMPEPLRSSILSKVDARGACEIRVLEKEFGVRFTQGSPPTAVSEVGGSNPCASEADEPNVKIDAADALTDSSLRFDWFRAPVAYCAYKKKLATALERAATKLNQSGTFRFPSPESKVCDLSTMPSGLWKQVSGTFCFAAKQNASTALECLYDEECTADCATGVTSLELLGALELFKGDDGAFDDDERKRFDRYYPEVVVGTFEGDGPGGIESTNSTYWGKNAKRKILPSSTYAKFGPYGLSGLSASVGAKDAYWKAHLNEAKRTSFNSLANFNENLVILGTSKEGAERFANLRVDGDGTKNAIFGQFEKDFDTLRKLLLSLDYNDSNESGPGNLADHPERWKAWQQVTSGDDYEAIANGTYEFRNLSAQDCPGLADRLRSNPKLRVKNPSEAQCPSLYKIRKIFSDPLYRDTKVRVQPIGTIPLGQVGLYVLSEHPDAPLTFELYPSSEDTQMNKYVASRVDACLGR